MCNDDTNTFKFWSITLVCFVKFNGDKKIKNFSRVKKKRNLFEYYKTCGKKAEFREVVCIKIRWKLNRVNYLEHNIQDDPAGFSSCVYRDNLIFCFIF